MILDHPDSNDQSDRSPAAGAMATLGRELLARLKPVGPALLVLAAVGSAALYGVFEPRYRSHAELMIQDLPPGFVDGQIDLLRGPEFMSQAYESEHLALLPELRDISEEDAVAWIARRLSVRRVAPEICEISSSTRRHPESAKRIVHA